MTILLFLKNINLFKTINMKGLFSTLAICLISLQVSVGHERDLKLSSKFVDDQLKASAEQYQNLVSVVPENKFPKTFEGGKQEFSDSA